VAGDGSEGEGRVASVGVGWVGTGRGRSFCRGGRRRYGGRCHSCTGREREMKAHRIEGVDEVINERRVH
jgi:hypothetical protein